MTDDLAPYVERVREAILPMFDGSPIAIAKLAVEALAPELRAATGDAHSVTYKRGWDAGHLCAAKDAENRIKALEDALRAAVERRFPCSNATCERCREVREALALLDGIEGGEGGDEHLWAMRRN